MKESFLGWLPYAIRIQQPKSIDVSGPGLVFFRNNDGMNLN